MTPRGRSVAFIRAVMVGRQGLTRDVLLRIFESAGAVDPVSHLATGNVSFGVTGPVDDIRSAVERAIERVVGRPKPVFIRTVSELRTAVASEPFADPPIADVFERVVSFFSAPAVKPLDLPMTTDRGDAVVFAMQGRNVYSVTRRLDGRPGTPSKLLDRAVARPFTNRNWNTVEGIVRRHESA